jgi:hypothetical protein
MLAEFSDGSGFYTCPIARNMPVSGVKALKNMSGGWENLAGAALLQGPKANPAE